MASSPPNIKRNRVDWRWFGALISRLNAPDEFLLIWSGYATLAPQLMNVRADVLDQAASR
jgi:hypothetical protein